MGRSVIQHKSRRVAAPPPAARQEPRRGLNPSLTPTSLLAAAPEPGRGSQQERTVRRPLPHYGRWRWSMQPHEIRMAVIMRDAHASYGEIARAVHVPEMTVRNVMHNELAMQDYALWWVATVPDPPSAA